MNLLLLLADDDRFDAFSHAVFGGTLFRATSHATLCAPSRLSLLTGIPPHVHGVVNNDFTPRELYLRGARGRSIVDIAHANGYLVGGVGKLFHIEEVERMQRYDVNAAVLRSLLFADCSAANVSLRVPEVSLRFRWGSPTQCTGVHFQDQRIATEAIRVADVLRATNRSFALLVGFLRPHVPWHIPPGHVLPTDAAQPTLECAGWFPETFEPTPFKDATKRDCNQSREAAWEFYNGARRYVYAQMRRVINAVPRTTLIVRTSDHGVNLGESCMFGKSGAFNKLATTVPLEIWAPWRSIVNAPMDVQLLDVLPTIADALDWKSRDDWRGQSLFGQHAGRSFVTTNTLGASIRNGDARLTLARLDTSPFLRVWSPLTEYTVVEFANHTSNCPITDAILRAHLNATLFLALKVH